MKKEKFSEALLETLKMIADKDEKSPNKRVYIIEYDEEDEPSDLRRKTLDELANESQELGLY